MICIIYVCTNAWGQVRPELFSLFLHNVEFIENYKQSDPIKNFNNF